MIVEFITLIHSIHMRLKYWYLNIYTFWHFHTVDLTTGRALGQIQYKSALHKCTNFRVYKIFWMQSCIVALRENRTEKWYQNSSVLLKHV